MIISKYERRLTMPRTQSKIKYPVIPENAPLWVPVSSASVYEYTDPGQQPDPSTSFSGLYVFGQVSDRSRRNIPTHDNSTAEIVTYTVEDEAGHRYFIDEYSPEGYNNIGSFVELPVYVKTFKKKNGDIGYSFCVQQHFSAPLRGERF